MARTKHKQNPNYIHSCNEPRIELAEYLKPIHEIYETEDALRILGFFVSTAPINTANKGVSASSTKSLSEYGWSGNKELQTLERKLLADAEMHSFCMLKSARLDETLRAMTLLDEICATHPRAVIQHTVKNLKYDEEENLVATFVDSSRMQCLLRHIRNSLAHGLTYGLPNEMILLGDVTQDNVITARILIKKQTLLSWADIIEKGPVK